MTPLQKELLVGWLMAVWAAILTALVIFGVSGCAHVPVMIRVSSSPHAQVDAALSDVRFSQQSAASQVSRLSHLVTGDESRHAVTQLQVTINDLGLKLEVATGKVAWYEAQYDLVIGQRDWWQSQDAKDKKSRVQAEKERDALVWIFAVASGGMALSTFRSALQVIQMPWQLVALAGVFIGGFALGFTIARWSLRFLATFTPHLPI
jgi:hypothetical protein